MSSFIRWINIENKIPNDTIYEEDDTGTFAYLITFNFFVDSQMSPWC
jgi:hypothetical protein